MKAKRIIAAAVLIVTLGACVPGSGGLDSSGNRLVRDIISSIIDWITSPSNMSGLPQYELVDPTLADSSSWAVNFGGAVTGSHAKPAGQTVPGDGVAIREGQQDLSIYLTHYGGSNSMYYSLGLGRATSDGQAAQAAVLDTGSTIYTGDVTITLTTNTATRVAGSFSAPALTNEEAATVSVSGSFDVPVGR